MTAALDTSAVLAVIFDEPGGEKVETFIGRSIISAANLAEAISKMVERGWSDTEASEAIAQFRLPVVSLDRDLAVVAGNLRRQTIGKGLSLGDRACIATAIREGAVAVTADRKWADLDIGCEIELIR